MPTSTPDRRLHLAALFACTLAACGGGGADPAPAPAPPVASVPVPNPPPPPPACTDPATQITRGVVANGTPAAGTGTRPQLSTTDATGASRAAYLAKAGTIGALVTDNWDPSAGVGSVCSFTPTFTVAADGSGTHTTIQAAIDAVPAALASSMRVHILVKPGTYRGQVCAKDKAPITLYGTTAAENVVFVDNKANPTRKDAGVDANPCNPNTAGTSYGTSGSTTFAIYSNGFHAKNVTFANDFDETTVQVSGKQAVALMTQADRVVLENVRVLGNQDSLYVKSTSDTVARVYVTNSYVEGDVDFIFGRAVLVMEGSEVRYLASRQGASGGYMVAPSTVAGNAFGFLLNHIRFTAEAGAAAQVAWLGRSWDEGVASGTYVAGTSPNGQAVIRNSSLGAHIKGVAPWGTSTSGRAYSSAAVEASGNRFSEFANTGEGAAQ